MIYPFIGHAQAPSVSAARFDPLYAGRVTPNATTDGAVASPVGQDLVISTLDVELSTAPGGSASWEIMLMKNGSTTSLAATITGSATSASDHSDSVSFSAGDTASIRITPASTPTATPQLRWSLVGDSDGQQIQFEGDNTGTGAATVYYSPLGTEASGDSGVSLVSNMIVPTAGTISTMYVGTSANVDTGETVAFTFMKNNVAQTLTATITAGNNSNSDLSNSFSVAAGDSINIRVVRSGGATNQRPKASWIFTPDVDGQSILGFGSATTVTTGTTQTMGIIGTSFSTDPPNDLVRHIVGDFIFKNIYAALDDGVGGGSYTFTLYQESSATSLTATVTGTTPVSTTDDVVATAFESFYIQKVSNSATTAERPKVSFMLEAPAVDTDTPLRSLMGIGT